MCNDTTIVGLGAARIGSPQSIVDFELASWREIWLRLEGQCGAPVRSSQPSPVDLPTITETDVAEAAATFKRATSVGAGDFPPRLVASLSSPLRRCIATFLNEVERIGERPAAIAAALIHLIPKPSGGRRPIGVLPSIVRLWGRVRKPIMQRWVRENARTYDWATHGRSAEGAAWHHALLDEAATSEGLQSATAFIDLTKACEMVRLQDVWQAGCRYNFALVLLRLLLEAFSFGRYLMYQGGSLEPYTHSIGDPGRGGLCAPAGLDGALGRHPREVQRSLPHLVHIR